MKVCIVICLVFVANVLGKPASEEQQQQLHKVQVECAKTSGIDEETLKKIEAYEAYPEDDKMKVHSKCILKSVGVMDDEGKVNKEAMSNILKEIVPGKESDIVKTCVDKEGAGKSAFDVGKCLYVEINAARVH